MAYSPKNPIRMVTAASLFDGHDASINMIRRLLQDAGVEVIHLGHNRSVLDIVTAALQEGAQGICISSYQGGHMEYFKYAKDLFREAGADYIKIFGGGGGVIVHDEKKALEDYGIDFIFHPDDGRKLGLEGMTDLIVKACDFSLSELASSKKDILNTGIFKERKELPHKKIGIGIDFIEKSIEVPKDILSGLGNDSTPLVLGITGTGGAGKSSLVDELVQRFLNVFPDYKIGVVCVDPSKRKTGGALLGDRIRMNSLSRERTFMRSIASRGSNSEIAGCLPNVLNFLKKAGFDLIIAETSGIGQANVAITEVCDFSLYVMTSEFGAQSQLEKIDMIDYANFISINKADHRGSADALRDVKKQYRRSRKLFNAEDKDLPVYLTQAAQFNDIGVNELFCNIFDFVSKKDSQRDWNISKETRDLLGGVRRQSIIPPERQNYLAEIVNCIRRYKKETSKLSDLASDLNAVKIVSEKNWADLKDKQKEIEEKIPLEILNKLNSWDDLVNRYKQKEYIYSVRGKEIKQALTVKSLSGVDIPRVVPPKYTDWGDRLRFLRLENFPGSFPYTAGVFPLKRQGEDPTRMFAGEGTPERTNKRFHYLSKGQSAKRLSTAFDSVTLYGQDPHNRPDIYGKVGESGVSICTLRDMKKLFAGFDLCSPTTSVSMTINGPAPIVLAFFLNTAIDQLIEQKKTESKTTKLTTSEISEIESLALKSVRGTVQADILKEDQGQNTCIFSIDFALKMMGDIQQYFIDEGVRNFYSVSISGYHIAEAGANPISQLAFTLSNAFTYVEYYLSRGMDIDEFAPNLSFFFSNGLDTEYSVIGRVARRIWAIAMKNIYKANDRSQKLKYHIQTSGRSLHAQEIDFNDIRTTLQALIAVNDNCNSLHTNAYDEAITTPTEESVRRAMAIQMIINKEFGAAKNENSNQGSFFIEELTDLVEEAVLEIFIKINERGGVLGAMETQYQRGQIQEESMFYETLKHNGELPIVGVNTYINPKTLEDGYVAPKIELARASYEEKDQQLNNLNSYKDENSDFSFECLNDLKKAALSGDNIFAALMKASRHCSLFQMTEALYEVGGQYRRNL